jgi:hypothetical protein
VAIPKAPIRERGFRQAVDLGVCSLGDPSAGVDDLLGVALLRYLLYHTYSVSPQQNVSL